MLWKKDKIIQSGFLLQKDVYTTNLLYEHNKFPIINNRLSFPFRKIDDKEEMIDAGPYLTILNNKKKSKSFSHKRKTKLKFPLPRPDIPVSSNIDFYKYLKGDVKLRYMDDDLNITSRKGKKIEYAFKDYQNDFDDKSNYNTTSNFLVSQKNTPSKNKDYSSYNSFFPLRKNIKLINESLKKINQKKKIIIRDSMFKTQIQQ